MQEPAERGRVDASLVVIHAELGEPGLAGILEPPAVARAGDAVFAIAVYRDEGAARVRHRDDRALAVVLQAAPVGEACALPHRASRPEAPEPSVSFPT